MAVKTSLLSANLMFFLKMLKVTTSKYYLLTEAQAPGACNRQVTAGSSRGVGGSSVEMVHEKEQTQPIEEPTAASLQQRIKQRATDESSLSARRHLEKWKAEIQPSLVALPTGKSLSGMIGEINEAVLRNDETTTAVMARVRDYYRERRALALSFFDYFKQEYQNFVAELGFSAFDPTYARLLDVIASEEFYDKLENVLKRVIRNSVLYEPSENNKLLLTALEAYYLSNIAFCGENSTPPNIAEATLTSYRGIIRGATKYIDPSDYTNMLCAFRGLGWNALSAVAPKDNLNSLIVPSGMLGGVGKASDGNLTAFEFRGPQFTSRANIAVKSMNHPPYDSRDIFGSQVHEIFVSVFGIRRVYEIFPSCPPVFMLSFGGGSCEVEQTSGAWCRPSRNIVNVVERYEGTTMFDYKEQLSLNFSAMNRAQQLNELVQLVALLLLLTDGLNTAYEAVRFSHGDMHLKNIFVIPYLSETNREVREVRVVRLTDGTPVKTSALPKIIDYGRSGIEYEGIYFAPNDGLSEALNEMYQLALHFIEIANRLGSVQDLNLEQLLTDCFFPSYQPKGNLYSIRRNLKFLEEHNFASFVDRLKRVYRSTLDSLRLVDPTSPLL